MEKKASQIRAEIADLEQDRLKLLEEIHARGQPRQTGGRWTRVRDYERRIKELKAKLRLAWQK
jgi:hypothetical protein